MAGYFATRSEKIHSIQFRAKKLLAPCLFWAIIYGVVNGVRGRDVFPEGYTLIRKLLATPSLHLWFLPFLFFSTVSIDMVKKKSPRSILGLVSGCLACALIGSASAWQDLYPPEPFQQYLHATPAMLIGIFLGSFNSIDRVTRTLILLSFWGITLHFAIQGRDSVGITYFVGFTPCIILLAKSSTITLSHDISILSSTMFGVYLCHLLILELFRYVGLSGASLPILVFPCSILVILLGRKFIPTRIVNLIM